ncbi:MAG: PorP/SprF family type IX secretion system membrane protein [Flavobacteriales bacterium]|nr:PorP/SprF family type IX secretion system membrane protein [Flavobacteriales bacterium]
MKLRLTILSLLCASGLFAQDIHLTQANMTPLLVNPANAGAEYTIRGILNYRTQWGSVSEPYVTMMAAYDMNFKKPRNKTGYFAGGLYVYNDKAGASQMKTTQVNLSLAYHVNLNERNTLGLGLQGGYFQRSANINQLTWGSQFDGYQYNENLATGESAGFNGISFGSTDYTTGLLWTYRNQEKYFSGNDVYLSSGISFHHISKPDIETQGLIPDELHYRYIWHGNGIIGVNEKFSVLPYLYFSRQGPINEIMFGSDVLYKLKQERGLLDEKGMAIGGGLYYRWGDAFIPSLLIQYANYTFGFTYDINTSSLSNATNKNGGFEISLRYVYPNPFGQTKSTSRFN